MDRERFPLYLLLVLFIICIFNQIFDFNIYIDGNINILFFVKFLLSIILILPTIKAYRIFNISIKDHTEKAKEYEMQYFDFFKCIKGNAEPDEYGLIEAKQYQIDYLNKLAEACSGERAKIKEDISNLIKILIVPLSAISVLWFGKAF